MPSELTDPRWFVLVGAVFVAVAMVGAAVGPVGLGLIRLDPIADAGLLELLTEGWSRTLSPSTPTPVR